MSNFVSVLDFEEYAYKHLPKVTYDFFKSGAGKEQTLGDNRRSFNKFKIRPRCLRNVAERDLSTVILGHKISMPIGISPSAMQKMAHPQGECAIARAAQALGTIYTLSTMSTCSIEEVAQAAPHAIKWFQLYIYKDRNVTCELVRRAEKAGYKALVLTVDAPVLGIRLADLRNNFTMPSHLKLANFEGTKATRLRDTQEGSAIKNYVSDLFDPGLKWDDVKWLKSITNLPIVLKGILTAEDALLGLQAGASAIQVSNHGARQLDGTASSIEVLPEIVKAVGDKVEVYLDGGVTDGVDVLKAVALGAKMVFIGRAALWGLAHSGQQGVKRILNILKSDLSTALACAGYSKVTELEPNLVVHENFYAKL